jgi:hypothetical protein
MIEKFFVYIDRNLAFTIQKICFLGFDRSLYLSLLSIFSIIYPNFIVTIDAENDKTVGNEEHSLSHALASCLCSSHKARCPLQSSGSNKCN